jgi:hypothetical protein
MYRYNICHRLTTGELVYLGKQQQWVSDVTQAITVHATGAQAQRASEGAGTGDVLEVFLVPLRQTTAQTTTVFSAVPKASRQACGPNVRVARRA